MVNKSNRESSVQGKENSCLYGLFMFGGRSS